MTTFEAVGRGSTNWRGTFSMFSEYEGQHATLLVLKLCLIL